MAAAAITNVQVGDWVRFYRNGQMVIGVVQYIAEKSALLGTDLFTDQGSVDVKHVLEIRRAVDQGGQ